MRSFKISTLLALASLLAMGVFAQSQPKRLAPRSSAYSHKLSSSLRQMVYTHTDKRLAPQRAGKPSRVCALVKTTDATAQPLCDNGCVPIAQIGDIFVADIPIHVSTALRQNAATLCNSTRWLSIPMPPTSTLAHVCHRLIPAMGWCWALWM